MVTLISVHNSDGLVGRCDARCHEAEGTVCSCICGGRYHGGRAKGDLEERVQAFAEELLGRDAAELLEEFRKAQARRDGTDEDLEDLKALEGPLELRFSDDHAAIARQRLLFSGPDR